MRVGIIGAGNVAHALGKSFVRGGHDVTIADRTPEKAKSTASEVGAKAAGDFESLVREADVIVLAVTFRGGAEAVSKAIASQADGKIVIDCTNPLNETYSGLVTEGGPSAGERVQSWLPRAKVVKAFNTVFASKQADPVVDGQPADALFATDDDTAIETFSELASSAGFRPIHVGQLARSKELEALGFLSISLQISKQGNWQSAWKLLDPPPAAVRETAAAGHKTAS